MTGMLVAAAPLQAANDQVQRGPVPAWVVPAEPMPVPEGAGGLVFVRSQDYLVHLDSKGLANYLGYRIRILHPNALQAGNISLAWLPSGGAPTVHFIRVHRGGEAIDVLKNASFEILRREGQLEAAMLDGMLTAILRVPDLRVGDELEVGMTIRSSDPTLGGSVAGSMFLTPEPSPGRFHLGLSWDEGQEPRIRMTPNFAAVARRQGRVLDLRFDNPPMLLPPAGSPARYRLQRTLEYSDFTDWASISRIFAPLYSKASTLAADSPLKAEAKRIAAAHPDPLARASAALKLVQQEVRYIYVGLDGGNFTPATADETWRRRYGDCKGKTTMLLALLAEMGIEAEPVLVNGVGGDDGLNERLPNPALFNHVLVRARIGGASYWLDGTLPPVAEPSTTPVIDYRWALPLTVRGGTIEQLEWRPAQRPEEVVLHEIDARAGFDQPAKITRTTILRGITGLQEQAQFSALTQAQLLSAFRQAAIGDTFQSIDDVKWRYDPKARASIVTVTGTGTVDWSDEGGGSKSLTLPGGGFSPPDRRFRPADQVQDAPYYNEPEFSCHVTTVRLPSSSRPSGWSFNKGFDTRMFGRNYYRDFEMRDGAIRMVRGSRTEQREFDPATAARDNERIAGFDDSMAQISYDPTGNSPSVGKSVPATYEIDWTADRVPCLASAAGN